MALPDLKLSPAFAGGITLTEVMRKIENFLNMLPTVRFVIIVGPKGSEQLAATRNVEKREAATMMKQVLNAYENDERRVQVPSDGSPLIKTPFS